MRLAQEAREQAAALSRQQEIERRQRELERKRQALEAQIAALRAEFEAEEEELKRLIAQEQAADRPRCGRTGKRWPAAARPTSRPRARAHRSRRTSPQGGRK